MSINHSDHNISKSPYNQCSPESARWHWWYLFVHSCSTKGFCKWLIQMNNLSVQCTTEHMVQPPLLSYTDVVVVDKLQVPGDCDPTPMIDKLLALFMQLEDNKLVYTEAVWAIILLSKLPPQIEKIAQSYDWKTIDAMTLTFVTICNNAIMNWQQCSSGGKQKNPQELEAKKLSNIQCKGKDPQFQQQHLKDLADYVANAVVNVKMTTAPAHAIGCQYQMCLGYPQYFSVFYQHCECTKP